MQRRFLRDSALIEEIEDLGTFNPIAVVSIPLSAVYCIIGLSITQGDRDLEFFRSLYWFGVFELVLVGILYGIAVTRVDYKRQTVCGGLLCGFSGGNCIFTLFSEDARGEIVETLSIVFFIIFVAVFIGEYIYPKLYSNKNDILVNNLSRGYLEISDKGICGISFSDVTVAGNGAYFELEYGDIRHVRTAQTSASDKQYYNLYIDNKYGTYNLSINDAKTACELINKAVADVKAGREVNFYSQGESDQNNLREDEWRCIRCGKINKIYIGTCGCGQEKPK